MNPTMVGSTSKRTKAPVKYYCEITTKNLSLIGKYSSGTSLRNMIDDTINPARTFNYRCGTWGSVSMMRGQTSLLSPKHDYD